MRKLVATLAFSSVAVIGIEKANDFAVLDAMYAITSEYMTDPPADDRPDRVLLAIQGREPRTSLMRCPVLEVPSTARERRRHRK